MPFEMYSYVSLGFPEKVSWAPRNFSGSLLRQGILRSPIVNDISFDWPAHIESDLHFRGSSLRFIVAAYLLILLIMRWCVFLFVVMILKSSANGVEIILFPSSIYPCFISVFRYSIMGLNTMRNIVEDSGSPWNTPFLNINGFDFQFGPMTVPFIFEYSDFI